jgi:type VI secretion system secreted protein VgrG
LQEQATPTTVCQGSGGCRWFTSGFKFTLKEHYRADQNQEYLLTTVHHSATQGGDYEVGSGGGEGPTYHNSFECVPSSTTFRPARVTPQPIVQGCQTAVVVGPGGEEIYTDKYGRVKVQFFWDRLGKKNASSSCWIRVSHPWAGQNWGAIAIPRIGQEVIVGFLEGDPDQPIIVGRVYNAEQMPPWSLPANATQSGVLTRSSKGGSPANANALRFEDKKGSEMVWFHAEKDMATEVEHDKALWVGHDETCQVDHDRTRHVKHDETVTIDNNETRTVHANQMETIDKDQTITVHKNKTESIDKDVVITIGSTLTETVALNYAETVGGAMEVTVGGLIAISAGAAMAEIVGLARSESVGGSSSESVGGNKSIDVGKDISESAKGNRIIEISKDQKETVGGQYTMSVTKELSIHAKKIELIADDEIDLKTGDAQIVLKSNGDIMIQGGKINIKGSGDIIIKGSSIKEN